MELVKNIFFNTDKIVENSNLKISYVGNLYQNGSDDVYLHCGFGENWDNISDIKMEKTELGFQCEIEVGEFDKLNLCFKDSNNNWDNNEGNNYIFNVEKYIADEEESTNIINELSLVPTKDNGMQVHKGLRKSYIWSKKVKLAVYKMIRFFPKIISGNYKRKVSDAE